MTRFLANENVAGEVVEALRAAGCDIAWMTEEAPGTSDPVVLSIAFSQQRVLLTFDKDFGELAFRRGLSATHGVLLLRPRLQSPESLIAFAKAVLGQPIPWTGHFCVAREGRIRVVPLPS